MSDECSDVDIEDCDSGISSISGGQASNVAMLDSSHSSDDSENGYCLSPKKGNKVCHLHAQCLLDMLIFVVQGYVSKCNLPILMSIPTDSMCDVSLCSFFSIHNVCLIICTYAILFVWRKCI